jgi:phage tail P2-like protein
MDWTAVFEPVWTVSLLPRNATAEMTACEGVDGDLVARIPLGLIAASRRDTEVPAIWLAYLAAERSVDEYSSEWPEERRRAVTAASFAMHRVKGTRPALDLALAPMGYSNRVVEWFEVEPSRRPYTFRISITIDDDRRWALADRREMIRVADRAKNAHTKLEAFEVRRRHGPATVHVGGYLHRRRTIRVGQLPTIETVRLPSLIHIGAVTRRARTVRVGPRPQET